MATDVGVFGPGEGVDIIPQCLSLDTFVLMDLRGC